MPSGAIQSVFCWYSVYSLQEGESDSTSPSLGCLGELSVSSNSPLTMQSQSPSLFQIQAPQPPPQGIYRPTIPALWGTSTLALPVQARVARKLAQSRTMISLHGLSQINGGQNFKIHLCSKLCSVLSKNPQPMLLSCATNPAEGICLRDSTGG